MDELRVQGRVVTLDELDGIRGLIAAHPQWGRYHLSVHLAQQWNWRNGAGQLKDMAARSLLLKLERRGLLLLPICVMLGQIVFRLGSYADGDRSGHDIVIAQQKPHSRRRGTPGIRW